jgi:hypothetical protein
MSLIPTADMGAPGDNYFVAADGGVARALTILPAEGNFGAASAELSMFNGITDASLNPMRVVHYVPAVTGGGLQVGLYQAYLYGPSVGGNNIAYLFYGQGLGNNNAVFGMNRARPLDGGRMGKIVGTGAAQVVACASIVAGSLVNLAFVAGTPAAADVAITITPNTSFSLTLPLNAVYNYEVIG